MLYQSTCVGFEYGLSRCYFPGQLNSNKNPLICYYPYYPSHSGRCRNINLLPIDYAFLPYLRSRLTPGGKSWPGKPWAYGEYVSHTFYRYSCQHLLLKSLHDALSVSLHCYLQYSPTTPELNQESAASVPVLSPGTSSAQIRWTSELLRFL